MARILLVDDEEPAREVLRGPLRLGQHEVMTAPSAEDALKLMERASFDVVITDNIMPGMSGVELAQRIAERGPAQRVLLITAEPSLQSAKGLPASRGVRVHVQAPARRPLVARGGAGGGVQAAQ